MNTAAKAFGEELIDRYVYAVVRQLPARGRDDIEKEIRSLISDMLDERRGADPAAATDNDVRVVLAELGTPSELAAKYDPDGDKPLLSAPYARIYRRVVPILVIVISSAVLLAGIIEAICDGELSGADSCVNGIVAFFSEWLPDICSTALAVFAAATIFFIMAERKGMQLKVYTGVDSLPRVPSKNEVISPASCIFGLAFGAVITAVLCLCPQYLIALSIGDSVKAIPVLNAEAVRGSWYLWTALFLFGAVRETVKLIDGSYTRRVGATSLAADVLSCIVAAIGFLRTDFISGEFLDAVTASVDVTGENAEIIARVFSSFSHVALAVFIFALMIDAVTSVIRSRLFLPEK